MLNHRIPDDPLTLQELLVYWRTFPDHIHRCRPSREVCELIGLDPDRLRPVDLLAESFRRQLLATCAGDRDFCDALRMLLKGGEA